MNQPKVSVIIPVYNSQKYLRECLDSIVNQTLKEIEIICVDDGSTDESLEILKEYDTKDSRVHVFTQPNKNAGAARNNGLKHAHGEYLLFVDSDDFFNLNMLEHSYKKALIADADMVVFSANEYNMKTGKIFRIDQCLRMDLCPPQDPFSPEDISEQLFQFSRNVTWNKLIRRSIISKYNIEFQEIPRANDVYFTCLSMALSSKISILNEELITYRTGTGMSLQQTNFQTPTSFWDAFTETKNGLERNGIYEKYKKSYINRVLNGIIYDLHTLRGTDSFFDAHNLISNNGNAEFQFFDNPLDYYYNQGNIREYYKLFGNTSSKVCYFLKYVSYNIKKRVAHHTTLSLSE